MWLVISYWSKDIDVEENPPNCASVILSEESRKPRTNASVCTLKLEIAGGHRVILGRAMIGCSEISILSG